MKSRRTVIVAQNLLRYKQRGQQTFFRQFLMVYSRLRSVPFAFRHSLKAVFPCAPRLSVAVYVVGNHCGTLNFRSGQALPRTAKVVRFESGCCASGWSANSVVFSNDELHQCLQREPAQRALISDCPNYADNPLDFCPQLGYAVSLEGGENMAYQRKPNKNYARRLFPIKGYSRLCFL